MAMEEDEKQEEEEKRSTWDARHIRGKKKRGRKRRKSKETRGERGHQMDTRAQGVLSILYLRSSHCPAVKASSRTCTRLSHRLRLVVVVVVPFIGLAAERPSDHHLRE